VYESPLSPLILYLLSFLYLFSHKQRKGTKVNSMKLLILFNLLVFATCSIASNVEYSVVAFPQSGESVVVTVNNNDYILKRSQHDCLFTGSAPFGATYRYSIVSNGGKKTEKKDRHLSPDATATGNEFFDRSRTVFDVPDIPSAYDPIYPGNRMKFIY
jgi:hypothetical protein